MRNVAAFAVTATSVMALVIVAALNPFRADQRTVVRTQLRDPKTTQGWIRLLVKSADGVEAFTSRTPDGKVFDCLVTRRHQDELTVIQLCTLREKGPAA